MESKKSENFPHWKQLALRAAREKDTDKLIALVNELLEQIERDKAKPTKTNAWE